MRAFFVIVWMTILLPTRTDDMLLVVWEENRKFMAVICVWFMDFYSAYVLNNFKVNVYLSLLDLKSLKFEIWRKKSKEEEDGKLHYSKIYMRSWPEADRFNACDLLSCHLLSIYNSLTNIFIYYRIYLCVYCEMD